MLYSPKKSEDLKIVVGLGNPEPQYQLSRHNFGFLAVDYIVAGISSIREKEESLYVYYEGEIEGERVVLFKPTTYMNRSGIAVKEVLGKYGCSEGDLIVLYDDIDIELGKIRLRMEGGSSGHKGVQSIIDHLQKEGFVRIRLGLKRGDFKPEDLTSYVLAEFTEEEKPLVERALDLAEKALIRILRGNLLQAMNIFNQ